LTTPCGKTTLTLRENGIRDKWEAELNRDNEVIFVTNHVDHCLAVPDEGAHQIVRGLLVGWNCPAHLCVIVGHTEGGTELGA
jgi:hypothetical protein